MEPEIKKALEKVDSFYLKIPPSWSYRVAGRTLLADYHDAVAELVQLMKRDSSECTAYEWGYGDFCYSCGRNQDAHR